MQGNRSSLKLLNSCQIFLLETKLNIFFFSIFLPLEGIQMLTLLVPILITYLQDPAALKIAKKQTIQLHDNSLEWLKRIGPKYPEVRFIYRDNRRTLFNR